MSNALLAAESGSIMCSAPSASSTAAARLPPPRQYQADPSQLLLTVAKKALP